MSIKNKVDLKSDADVYLPDNITEEISAGDVRQRIKDLADSTLNLIDGGLVVQAEAGYSGAITPSSNYAFATKKYVDDSVAAVSLAWGSITGTITNQTDLITYLSTNYQPLATNLTSLAALSYVSTSFVKMTAAGTFALDTNTYLTSASLSGYAKLDLSNQPFTGNLLKHVGTLGEFHSELSSVSPYFALKNTSSSTYFSFTYNTVNTRAVWNVTTNCSQLEIFYNSTTALKLDSTTISAVVPTNMIWYAYPSFSVMTTFTASTGNWNFAGTAQNLLTVANGIKIGNNTDTAATAGGGSLKYTGGVAYLSNATSWLGLKTNFDPNVTSTTSTATLTVDTSTTDLAIITAQAAALDIAAPTGSPTQGRKLLIRIKDDGTARAITFNAIFRAVGITLPTTTVISKYLYIGAIYNSTDTKWDVIAVKQEV